MNGIIVKNNHGKDFVIEHEDNAPAVTVSSTDLGKVKSVDTIEDLRNLKQIQPTVWVSGYHTKGDGAFGSHIFEWDETSTEDDNDGTTIKLFGVLTGRYKLKHKNACLEFFGIESPEFVKDGIWHYDENMPKSKANLGTIIDPSVDITLEKQGTGSGFGCLVRHYSGGVNVKWFGAVGNGATPVEDTTAIQNAVNLGKDIYIPNGYYQINEPIVISSTAGKFNITGQGQYSVHLQMTFDDVNKFCIDINPDVNGDTTYKWGMQISNLHIKSVHSTTISNSALRAKNMAYLRLHNISIDAVNGSGLYLDKVQDSDFLSCNIQNCGKSTGDGTVNSETTHYPITITSSITGDECNMLRFNSFQVEQNRVSPAVKVTGGIGIMFNAWHSEIRHASEWYTKDLFDIASADCTFTNMNIDRFRYGLVWGGYGTLKIEGGRKFGAIAFDTNGKHGKLYLENTSFVQDSSVGQITWASGAIDINANNCTFGDLLIRYPAGTKVFNTCNFTSNLGFANSGGNSSQSFIDCTVAGDFTSPSGAATTYGHSFIGGKILGDLNGLGSNSSLFRTSIGGTTSYDQADILYFQPKSHKVDFNTSKPQYGHWSNGDIVYNSTPSAGGNIGWVCTTAGSPGTWKTFGTIES